MEWARILAYITEMVDQELLLRNGYLVAENRILRSQLKGRLRLTDDERATLGEMAHRLACSVGIANLWQRCSMGLKRAERWGDLASIADSG